MDAMYAGYMWGEHTSWTVRLPKPCLVFADASLHLLSVESGKRVSAVAWVRSVTVRDPATGAESEKPSPSAVPIRIESNAVAVTFGLNSNAGNEAEGLVHAFMWPL